MPEDGSFRRHVAVLFVDISGFTRLVESVPPEEVYRTVRPVLDELSRVVRRHGGEIQQVLGDGFMAVFGLRTSGGDEVGSAVRAALATLQLSSQMPVHVGVECGEVLVTPAWEPGRFAVWGRVINIGKRLCDLAAAGELQLGPVAFGRVAEQVGAATSASVTLKGITDAIVAHRVVA
jgi:class 3 adenylate cyclase